MRTQLLVKLKSVLGARLERWKIQKPNEPFDPLRPGHFLELYTEVCADSGIQSAKHRLSVLTCTALALLGEPNSWPASPPRRDDAEDRVRRRRLLELIRTNSRLVRRCPVAFIPPRSQGADGQELSRKGKTRKTNANSDQAKKKADRRIAPAEIKDAVGMAARLQKSEDAISKFLWARFLEESQKAVARAVSDHGGDPEIAGTLAEALTHVVGSEDGYPYEKERYSRVSLSNRTWELTAQHTELAARATLERPQEHFRIPLGCSLIRDAYPQHFDKRTDDPDSKLRWVSSLVVCRGGHIEKILGLERTPYFRPTNRLLRRLTLADRPHHAEEVLRLAAWNVIQIVLAHLNGWGRPTVKWRSRDWDGLPRPAARAMKYEIGRLVDLALNYLEGKGDDNYFRFQADARRYEALYGKLDHPELKHADREAIRRQLRQLDDARHHPRGQLWPEEYHPRVPGFPEGQSRSKWTAAVYHRLVSKADFAQCHCYCAAQGRANQVSRQETCEHFHRLGWVPEEMDLPAFLRKAVLGTHGKLLAVSLSGGLLSVLLAKLGLKLVDVAVWDCDLHPAKSQEGKGLYVARCATHDITFDPKRHRLRLDPRWILLGEAGGFKPVKMWFCFCKRRDEPKGADNYFPVSKFREDGEPDPGAADFCPRCRRLHGTKWATLYSYIIPQGARVDLLSPDDGPHIPPVTMSLERRFESALEELTIQGYEEWVIDLLWNSFRAWQRDSDSGLLTQLMSRDADANWEAYLELKTAIRNDRNPAPPASRDEFERQWSSSKPIIAKCVGLHIQPPDDNTSGSSWGRTEDEDQ